MAAVFPYGAPARRTDGTLQHTADFTQHRGRSSLGAFTAAGTDTEATTAPASSSSSSSSSFRWTPINGEQAKDEIESSDSFDLGNTPSPNTDHSDTAVVRKPLPDTPTPKPTKAKLLKAESKPTPDTQPAELSPNVSNSGEEHTAEQVSVKQPSEKGDIITVVPHHDDLETPPSWAAGDLEFSGEDIMKILGLTLDQIPPVEVVGKAKQVGKAGQAPSWRFIIYALLAHAGPMKLCAIEKACLAWGSHLAPKNQTVRSALNKDEFYKVLKVDGEKLKETGFWRIKNEGESGKQRNPGGKSKEQTLKRRIDTDDEENENNEEIERQEPKRHNCNRSTRSTTVSSGRRSSPKVTENKAQSEIPEAIVDLSEAVGPITMGVASEEATNTAKESSDEETATTETSVTQETVSDAQAEGARQAVAKVSNHTAEELEVAQILVLFSQEGRVFSNSEQ